MTVSSTLNRKEYAGDGVTTAFATSPVVFFDAGDLDVYVVSSAGVATLKTITTHYTVTGGSGSTGTVTMLTAPASGETLVIVRTLDLVQEVDFVNNDGSDAEVGEDALDKLVMIAQQHDARIERSFRLPDSDVTGASTEIPTPAGTSLIGWNTAGTALQNYSTSTLSSALTTAFTLTLLDDTTAAEARTTLGASSTTPADDVFHVVGSADATKKVRLEVDGLTTGTIRVATAPDYDIRFGNLPAGIGPLPYAGSTIPTGWLECDGSAVSRTTYAALFTAIGTTWGTGDGSTTFNLPDMRGKVAIGSGTGTVTASGLDADVDTTNDTLTVASNNTKWVTGMSVVFTLSSGTITGLTSGNTYYVIRASATTVKLASSLANAQNGTAVDMTAKSSPVWSITHTYTARTLGEYGGEEAHAMSRTEHLAHTHTTDSQGAHTHGVDGYDGTGTTPDRIAGTDAAGSLLANDVATTSNGAHTHTAASTGGNAAMNIMQPFAVVKYIISY